MTDKPIVHCFDCGYDQPAIGRGGIGDLQRAKSMKAGHVGGGRAQCEHVVVLTGNEAWLFRHGWIPASVVDEWRDALQSRINRLDRRVTRLEMDVVEGAMDG